MKLLTYRLSACALLGAMLLGCGSEDVGPTQSAGAGTVAFWIRPNWDASDPLTASLIRLRTEDTLARVQIFKNGIYLRVLATEATGAETNLSLSLADNIWIAGVWHHVAVGWGRLPLALYVDGQLATNGTEANDLPSGTEFSLETVQSSADATFSELLIVDRTLDSREILTMYEQGPP